MGSTQVLFPRFEAEIPPAKKHDIAEAQRRAFPRGWLSEEQARALTRPNPEVVAEVMRPRNAKGHWWGVRHLVKELVTKEDIVDSPFEGGANVYRSRVIEHEYLWDEEAVEGKAHEFVLERYVDEEVEFRETAALLITDRLFYPRYYAKQQFVVRDEALEWQEPAFQPWVEESQANFYLTVITGLVAPHFEETARAIG